MTFYKFIEHARHGKEKEKIKVHIVNVCVDFIESKNIVKFIATRFFSIFLNKIQCINADVGEKPEKKAKKNTVYSILRIHRMRNKPLLLSINMKY